MASATFGSGGSSGGGGQPAFPDSINRIVGNGTSFVIPAGKYGIVTITGSIHASGPPGVSYVRGQIAGSILFNLSVSAGVNGDLANTSVLMADEGDSISLSTATGGGSPELNISAEIRVYTK